MATLNGSSMAVFTVKLSAVADTVIAVTWQTQDGTGKAGVDYKATSGTVTFQPGETQKQIQVEVYGRSPNDTTETRQFDLLLNPPTGAVLDQSVVGCAISVVTEGGATFLELYLPQGPRGRKGDGGDDGLSAYQLAMLGGFEGTLAQWLATVTGRNVELRNNGTWIQWRPQDTENPQAWQNLIELATLKGADGKEVSLQKTATYIQWRLGSGQWQNLVALSDLKADPQPLKNRSNWATGTTYNPGDYVAATSTTSSAKSLYFLIDAAPYVSNTEPKSDLTHWLELQPPQGAKGDNIELQRTSTYIQWRVVGDTAWQNLIAVADLKGDPGNDGKSVELQKSSTYVQWRKVGDTDWINLIALADLVGANGKNVELQKGSTYIQWRVVGDSDWQNLIAIADLTGAAGKDGSTWYSGTTVPAASLGKDTDWYLKTDSGGLYNKASGAWSLKMTIGGTGIQWFTGTSVPSNTTGKDGDLHLHKTTGEIRERQSTTSGGTTTTAWNVIWTILPPATSTQAKAALLTTVAATPAGVREFMEQYGFTSSYTNTSSDLNTITGDNDKTVVFSFDSSTKNIPFSGAYGRGIMFAGGGNYSTQVVWINGSNDQYVRFHNGSTTWSAWTKQAFNDNDLKNTPFNTLTLQNGWAVNSGGRAAYRKVLGRLEIDMHITGGAISDGTVVATLPAEFRPVTTQAALLTAQGTWNNSYPPRMFVQSNGQISFWGLTGNGAVDVTANISFQ